MWLVVWLGWLGMNAPALGVAVGPMPPCTQALCPLCAHWSCAALATWAWISDLQQQVAVSMQQDLACELLLCLRYMGTSSRYRVAAALTKTGTTHTQVLSPTALPCRRRCPHAHAQEREEA